MTSIHFAADSGAAYITPVLGGAIADGLLGSRTTLLAGGLLMAAGHGCMAVERFFLCGLVLLVLGNGLFKPTVSSVLSRLYEPPAFTALRDRVCRTKGIARGSTCAHRSHV
eukprot:2955514-Prymnesium_polylepis.1